MRWLLLCNSRRRGISVRDELIFLSDLICSSDFFVVFFIGHKHTLFEAGVLFFQACILFVLVLVDNAAKGRECWKANLRWPWMDDDSRSTSTHTHVALA